MARRTARNDPQPRPRIGDTGARNGSAVPVGGADRQHGDGRTFPPLGRLLEPGQPLALFEEELPRSGLLATRAWQFARTASGASVSWIGRRTRPGRGESRSGLGYDHLAPRG